MPAVQRAAGEVSDWRPVIAYAAVSAANQMLWLTYAPITTDAARHYGVSSGAVGWLAEIFPLLYVLLAVPTGRLVDRSLPRWLGVGALLTALGAVLRLGDGYGAVLAGQVLIAVAQPFVLNAVTRVSGTYLHPTQRATGIAVSSAGIFTGMVLALGLGAAFGGSHVAPLVAVQAVLAVGAAAWLLPALRRGRPVTGADTLAGDPGAAGGLRAVWADPRVRALTGLVCAGFGVFVALTTWLQTLLQPAGVGSTRAGVLLLVMVVIGVLGSALLPPVLVRRGSARAFVAASVIAGVASLLLLAAKPGFGVGLAASAVLGLFLLTDLPVIFDRAEQLAGAAGGTVSALLWLAGNAAGLVAALVVQALVHHPAAAFSVLAALLLAGLPLVRPATAPLPVTSDVPAGRPAG